MRSGLHIRMAAVLAAFLLGPAAALAGPFDWSLAKAEIRSGIDSVSVSLEWRFNNWEIRPNSAMVFSMVLKGPRGSLRIRPVAVYGRKVAGSAVLPVASGNPEEIAVTDVGTPITLRQTDRFPAAAGLDTLTFYLTVSEWTKGGGLVVRSTSKRGTFRRPPRPEDFRFTWRDDIPAVDRSEYRDLDIALPVRFEEGSSRFDESYGDNAAVLEDVLPALKALTSSRRFTVREVSLRMHVPPVGNDKESRKLSRQRALSLSSSLQGRGAFRVHKPRCEGCGEDWDGVREWVDGSRLRGDVRLREILSGSGQDDAIASALKSEKPAVWEILSGTCFPALGGAVLHVSYRPLAFDSPRMMSQVYEEVPEALTAHDFWRYSTAFGRGSREWLDILLTGVSCCPEDGALAFDAVMGLLDAREAGEASAYLALVADPGRSRFARAYWAYLTGRYDECACLLEELSSLSADYLEVCDRAVPFIEWVRGNVPWKKVNL